MFDLGLTLLSTIFLSYCDGVWMWQGAQSSLLECCLDKISRPRHFDMILHPVTLYWHWADQFLLYFLNAERQAKKQLVPFLKSLVWPGRGSNPQTSSHNADALPLSHCANQLHMKCWALFSLKISNFFFLNDICCSCKWCFKFNPSWNNILSGYLISVQQCEKVNPCHAE